MSIKLPETPYFETPNLDCLSVDPQDYRALDKLFCQLARYCSDKACAVEARQHGDIKAALKIEESLDVLYMYIPKQYRW